ncbi:MAG: TetR/AcrR family transcriptional regulator [Candidatus Cloacimonetes bacterium]|nr:TetR/AcrR family transcriptional regulator [Candidatus Cloacimonadota bacterium]
MRRKEREIEQRRQEILVAARQLFLKKGFESVSMEDIAGKAEFSRVTLYNYFKSKFDLLYEIIWEALEEDDIDFLTKVENINSAYERLKIYAKHQYEFFLHYPGYHLLIVQYRTYAGVQVSLSEKNLLRLHEQSEKSNNFIYNLILEGMKNGEFRKDLDPLLALNFFLKSIFAIVHPYVFDPHQNLTDLDREIEYLLRAFV